MKDKMMSRVVNHLGWGGCMLEGEWVMEGGGCIIICVEGVWGKVGRMYVMEGWKGVYAGVWVGCMMEGGDGV